MDMWWAHFWSAQIFPHNQQICLSSNLSYWFAMRAISGNTAVAVQVSLQSRPTREESDQRERLFISSQLSACRLLSLLIHGIINSIPILFVWRGLFGE